jgi:YVTN family beta-propeller protein
MALAFGAGALWVTSRENGTLSRVDPETGSVTDSVELGDGLGHGWVAADDDAVWVASMGDGTLSRIDPATLEATTIPIGDPVDRPYTIALGDGSVWVSDQANQTVTRVDAEAVEIIETIDVRPPGVTAVDFGPSGVAVDENGVWVSGHRADALTRIDPATNAVAATVCVGSTSPGRIAAGDGAVWVAEISGLVNRFSSESMEIESRVGPLYGPLVGSLELGGGSLWVANASHLVRIDPATSTVDGAVLITDEIPEDEWPGGLAVAYGGGAAWVTHPVENVIVEVLAP